MSLDDRKKKEQFQAHSLDQILNPLKIAQMRQQMEQHQKKELFVLKQQVERTKVMNDPNVRKDKAGTGGLKKEQVLTADGKPMIKQMINAEKQKAQVQRQLGQTEQSKKTA